MKTKQIKGVMMECSECHRLIPFEETISDKTCCPTCGGTTKAINTCTIVVREQEEGVNALIIKQWELFGKLLNEQTEYIVCEAMRRLHSERNND